MLLLDLHAVGEGDVAHVLDARADDHVVDAGGDQRSGEVDGLLAGAALAVERGGGRLDGQAGLQPGVAADVEALLAELLDTAGDDVLDLGGRDARPLDHLRVALGQEVAGVDVLVVALLLVAAADRRPRGLHDHDLTPLELAHVLACPSVARFPMRLPKLTDWPINQSGGGEARGTEPRPGARASRNPVHRWRSGSA